MSIQSWMPGVFRKKTQGFAHCLKSNGLVFCGLQIGELFVGLNREYDLESHLVRVNLRKVELNHSACFDVLYAALDRGQSLRIFVEPGLVIWY